MTMIKIYTKDYVHKYKCKIEMYVVGELLHVNATLTFNERFEEIGWDSKCFDAFYLTEVIKIEGTDDR